MVMYSAGSMQELCLGLIGPLLTERLHRFMLHCF